MSISRACRASRSDGLIERPQRLAVALQSMLTTAEAPALDTKTLFALEQDLLNLADAIGLHYFPHGPNAEPAGEAHGPRVIYDIRHVTTYAYDSPVSFARCSLRLEPRTGDGQQLISHSVEIRPRPAERTVAAGFLRHP